MMLRLADLLKRIDVPSGLRCRPALADDDAFLRQVSDSVRAPSLIWSAAAAHVLDKLMRQQFEAQRRHYLQHYPGCEAWVIERFDGGDGQFEPAGQMWLHLDDEGLRLVDIAVLPAHRSRGIASACLRALTCRADQLGLNMHLHVLIDNPARHWYARLGFVVTDVPGLHQAMTRLAVDQETTHEQA